MAKGTDNQNRIWYNKYTPINTSKEKIYQECANTEFQKTELKNLFLVRESSWIGKMKYNYLKKSHDHTNIDCIHLKDVIKGLIKRESLKSGT